MSMQQILSGMEISASGLAAERRRMEVTANNIANINTTKTADGGPYRRLRVSFATAMDQSADPGSGTAEGLRGVRVAAVTPDQSPLPKVHDPGHPDADQSGYVTIPNINLPFEMIDLVTASRAYEANLKSMETFRQLAEQSLSLLRGIR